MYHHPYVVIAESFLRDSFETQVKAEKDTNNSKASNPLCIGFPNGKG